jgi:hypothetical protein
LLKKHLCQFTVRWRSTDNVLYGPFCATLNNGFLPTQLAAQEKGRIFSVRKRNNLPGQHYNVDSMWSLISHNQQSISATPTQGIPQEEKSCFNAHLCFMNCLDSKFQPEGAPVLWPANQHKFCTTKGTLHQQRETPGSNRAFRKKVLIIGTVPIFNTDQVFTPSPPTLILQTYQAVHTNTMGQMCGLSSPNIGQFPSNKIQGLNLESGLIASATTEPCLPSIFNFDCISQSLATQRHSCSVASCMHAADVSQTCTNGFFHVKLPAAFLTVWEASHTAHTPAHSVGPQMRPRDVLAHPIMAMMGFVHTVKLRQKETFRTFCIIACEHHRPASFHLANGKEGSKRLTSLVQ